MELEFDKLDKHFPQPEVVHKKVDYEKINAIKEWLKTQPHLPEISEYKISLFLHACYNSMEQAEKTIEAYFTMRTENGAVFSDRTPESFHNIFNAIYCYMAPVMSTDECRCICFGLVDSDPSKYIVYDIGKLTYTLIDVVTHAYPYNRGWRLFIDAQGYSFGHLTRFSMNLGFMKTYLTYLQKAMPLRLKGIHIYNSFALVNQMIALLKPFIDRQFYNMIHTYTRDEIDALHEICRPEMFPKSAGGPLCVEEMQKETLGLIEKYQQWFIDDELVGRVDESKRKKKPSRFGWFFSYGETVPDSLTE